MAEEMVEETAEVMAEVEEEVLQWPISKLVVFFVAIYRILSGIALKGEEWTGSSPEVNMDQEMTTMGGATRNKATTTRAEGQGTTRTTRVVIKTTTTMAIMAHHMIVATTMVSIIPKGVVTMKEEDRL